MPNGSFEWALFTFFSVGAFGGWLCLAAALAEMYSDWKFARKKAKRERDSTLNELAKPVTRVTPLTHRNKDTF